MIKWKKYRRYILEVEKPDTKRKPTEHDKSKIETKQNKSKNQRLPQNEIKYGFKL